MVEKRQYLSPDNVPLQVELLSERMKTEIANAPKVS